MGTRELLDVEEALEEILGLIGPLEPESTPVDLAVGRALSQDVRAVRTLPPWDNSAMDGYALRSADVQSPPARLEVVEAIYAGQAPTRSVGPGQCARIMTGAQVPPGADAVVMQEKTRAAGAQQVDVLESVPPGASVRRAGEDAKAGELLLRRETSLGLPEAGLLWGQQIGTVSVPRAPRVAILSTGDELCGIEDAPNGRIVDSNSPVLAQAVRRAGGVPKPLGIARDTLADVVHRLSAAEGADLVLTVAGVSVGEKDYVRAALESIGVTMRFWKVAMRPGKPLAVGTRGRTLFMGLPGNPTSALVTFELFVRPALRKMQGLGTAWPRSMGVCAEPLRKAPGLTHFVRATAEWKDGTLHARPLATQGSGALRSAAAATHLLVFPKEARGLAVGDPVELISVSWNA